MITAVFLWSVMYAILGGGGSQRLDLGQDFNQMFVCIHAWNFVCNGAYQVGEMGVLLQGQVEHII